MMPDGIAPATRSRPTARGGSAVPRSSRMRAAAAPTAMPGPRIGSHVRLDAAFRTAWIAAPPMPGRALRYAVRFARATTASNSTWQPASASSGRMLSASLWLRPSLQGVKIMAVGTLRAT